MIWLSYLLKTILIQFIALVGYKLLLDKEPLGHLKRAYLLGSLVLSLVTPFLTVPRMFVNTMSLLSSPDESALSEWASTGLADTPALLASAEVFSWSDLLWALLKGCGPSSIALGDASVPDG